MSVVHDPDGLDPPQIYQQLNGSNMVYLAADHAESFIEAIKRIVSIGKRKPACQKQ
jgi:hypothetical protein